MSASRVPLLMGLLVGTATGLAAQADSVPNAGSCGGVNGGTLEGRVLREHTSEPVPDALLILRGTACYATTGLNGQFVISDIPAGLYRLAARRIRSTPSDSVAVIIRAGTTTRVEIPLTDLRAATPAPVDTTRAAQCIAAAHGLGGWALTRTDSLLTALLCTALALSPGIAPAFCVQGDTATVRRVKERVAWPDPRPVPAGDCRLRDPEGMWTLEHPSGRGGAYLGLGLGDVIGDVVEATLGVAAAPLGGIGYRCQLRRVGGSWRPYPWCWRTWVS
jgi:hypothetical protein